MKRMRKNNTEKQGSPQEIVTDPFGMYTGIPEDPMDRPVQDADDL